MHNIIISIKFEYVRLWGFVVLAYHPNSKRVTEMTKLFNQVAGSLAFFARERITPFIREQGGWVSLFFIS